jgi:hypothetical protein
MKGRQVNEELEIIWKNVAYFKVGLIFQHLPEGTEENQQNYQNP